MTLKNAHGGPRARSALLAAVLLATALLVATTAAPAVAGGPTTTTAAPGCPPVGPIDPTLPNILPGITIGPALVQTPGEPDRTLNASQSTAFIQSWLPASVVTHIPHSQPLPAAKVSHLRLTTTYAGTTTCITAWYAVLGTQVWVGMPAQSLGWASVVSDTWIAAPNPSFTVRAFAGQAKPVPGETAGTTTTTTKTTTTSGTATAKSSGSSGSSTWIWIVLAVVLIAAIGLWLAMRSRGRSPARTS